jgi:transcriptional regulator with XRE-family HTH domain
VKIAERFASNLTEQRKKAGFSQEELAFRAGLHRTQISLLETGKRLPRFETLIKLAGALAVPAEDLCDGIAWDPIVRVSGGLRVADVG